MNMKKKGIKSKAFISALCLALGFGAILEILTAYAPRAAVLEVYVDPNGVTPGGNPCYKKIQAAINDATNGDTIIIHQGTYKENIDFYGKAITVRSTEPANPDVVAATIIDGNQVARVVTFNNKEGNASVLRGLTVQNGKAGSGGGIFCYRSSPSIEDCIIRGNLSSGTYGGGGGIYCCYPLSPSISPKIIRCTISGNLASGIYGGGAGIYCYASSPTISECAISGNSSCFGRIICNCGEESYCNCGGGIYCYASSPRLSNCVVNGNSACYGGGIYCYSSSPEIASSPEIVNCTINRNSVTCCGGAIFCGNYSSPAITNCIMWNDSPDEICVTYGNPLVTHSNIQGNYGGEGNFDDDPRFIDPVRENFHLQSGSPCIDKGVSGTGIPAYDKDGHVRDSKIDVGAYEFGGMPPITITCPEDITVEAEGPDGVSASNTTIQAFLNGATTDAADDSITITNNAPELFGLGTTGVTFMATGNSDNSDNSGNSGNSGNSDNSGNTSDCTATVTVVDTTPPVITCPENITVEAETANGTPASNTAIQAFLNEATASDLIDGLVNVTNNAPAVFGLGDTEITFTAKDSAGNTSSCEATVTVVDTTPPVIICPENIILEAEGPEGVPVSNAAIQAFLKGTSATDKVDGSVIVTPECSGCMP